jgi:hypothetical protein
MNMPAPLARTAALLLTASLSTPLMAASAQRRSAPASASREAGPAPRQRQTPARPAATPRPNAGANPATAEGTTAPRQAQAEAGAERPFEELLAADAYGVYAEARGVGMLLEAPEVKAALGAAALFESEAAGLLRLANFVTENTEALAEARVAVALMPTRKELPQPLVAVRLPSAEVARAFEPKFRAFADEESRAAASGATPAPAAKRPARARDRARPAQAKAAPAAPRVVVRRLGSWLLVADKPFTLGRLGGRPGASLADSARFQNLRSRFANDSLFVYFDTERTQQSWAMQMQQAQQEPASEITLVTPVEPSVEPSGETRTDGPPPAPRPAAVASDMNPATADAGQTPTPTPEGAPTPAAEIEVVAPVPPPAPVAPPTEAQRASLGFSRLLGGLWGGVPRIPGAVAAGAGLEGGNIAVRLAVENPAEGDLSLIPFLPALVAGPPVTVEASAVAPASNDFLVVTSLDWERILNSLLGAAKENEERVKAKLAANPDALLADVDEDGRPVSSEDNLATMEKLLGFKLREDLLPALGDEVAVSFPLELFTGVARVNRRAGKEGEGEGEGEGGGNKAAPGFIVLVALDDPERMRALAPRLSLLLGFAGGGAAPGPAEKREGHEIRSLGAFAYAILGRFLVVSDEASHVRHAVDSYARGETLANKDGYRDATAWQPRQRLAHAYLSEGLMGKTISETRRMAEGSTDPLVLSTLPQLDLRPEPITFASTNEGDVLIHELRLPVSLGRVYAAAAVIGAREGQNIGAEASAAYAMQSVYHAEETYKAQKDRDRYATLEELLAEKLIEKNFIEGVQYRVEVNASGDRFEATATPKEYGKTGRRSFFVDQTGVVRAADHKGRPATAQDPPVD